MDQNIYRQFLEAIKSKPEVGVISHFYQMEFDRFAQRVNDLAEEGFGYEYKTRFKIPFIEMKLRVRFTKKEQSEYIKYRELKQQDRHYGFKFTPLKDEDKKLVLREGLFILMDEFLDELYQERIVPIRLLHNLRVELMKVPVAGDIAEQPENKIRMILSAIENTEVNKELAQYLNKVSIPSAEKLNEFIQRGADPNLSINIPHTEPPNITLLDYILWFELNDSENIKYLQSLGATMKFDQSNEKLENSIGKSGLKTEAPKEALVFNRQEHPVQYSKRETKKPEETKKTADSKKTDEVDAVAPSENRRKNDTP